MREIIAGVRAGGDRAVLDYTRRLDTAGAEPKPLRVAPEELDEALTGLELDLVAGLQVAIANVAEVAQAGVARTSPSTLARASASRCARCPWARLRSTCPAGGRPIPAPS